MPKDIREILKNDNGIANDLSKNHRQEFENRLKKTTIKRKNNFGFLKVAASFVLLVSIGFYFLQNRNSIETNKTQEIVNLSNVSPEMQQIENYYLTAINYEMSSIESTEENKVILDAYLNKMAKLTEDYKALTVEFSEKGIHEKIVNAMIDNLQLRLQILLELKDTINEMKTPKTASDEKNTI